MALRLAPATRLDVALLASRLELDAWVAALRSGAPRPWPVSVDLSAEGFKKMDKLAKDRGVSVASVVSDLAAYDFPRGGVDGVVSVWCHVPPEVRRILHAKIVEALRPAAR